jgi:signal transduction histidine kinase
MRVARTLVLAAFLVLGAAACLATRAQGFALEHALSATVLLAHRADRSTYLVGEVAHRVDDISAALDEQPGETSIVAAKVEVARDLERIDQAMRELPAFLDEEDAPTLAEVSPRLEALKTAVSQVVALSGSRYTAESRAIFQQRVLPIVATLEEPLDRLIDLNKAESQRLLDALEPHLMVLGRRQLTLGGAYIGFFTLVAFATLRLIDRQHLALARRVAEIEQANRDLDAFAGRVAHDLRGPLMPIVLGAARLRAVAARHEGAEEAVSRITAAAERANTLIESLLAFSRAGYSGRNAGLEGPSSAANVVERALRGVREVADAAHVELSSDVSAVSVAIDASLLEQVLDNLVTNAIRYIGEQTTRRVSVRVFADKNIARFEVADTGVGVPPEARDRIFEPFFRLNPSVRTGSGLGLATAKRIVESRGGRIGVASAPGGGALFWFTLPVHPNGPSSAEARIRSPVARRCAQSTRRSGSCSCPDMQATILRSTAACRQTRTSFRNRSTFPCCSSVSVWRFDSSPA